MHVRMLRNQRKDRRVDNVDTGLMNRTGENDGLSMYTPSS